MHCGAADRLAAVVASHLQRIVTVDDAIIGPVELGLLAFVGSKILQRTKIRACIERHDGEAVLGELAGQRAASRAGPDDYEVDCLVLRIFPHRHPRARAEDVGRTSMAGAWGLPWIIRHGDLLDARSRR